jgi:hypothetical protein
MRCAAPLRRVAPVDVDVVRAFILIVYGDSIEGLPASAVQLLCWICATGAEVDAFVEGALAWHETPECEQFVARARASDFGPHQRLLAELGTSECRRRIACVASTAKGLLVLERSVYATQTGGD